MTLSDGTLLPRDAVVCIPSRARHLDTDLHGPTSSNFEGFRFSKLQDQHFASEHERSDATLPAEGSHFRNTLPRYQLTTTDPSFLAWGHGRHACPGRFYASTIMKLMTATILIDYDIRFEDGLRPKDVLCSGAQRMPARDSKVLMRKR